MLVIPKKHIEGLNHITDNDRDTIAELMLGVSKVAKELGLSGYKTIFNTGKEGGQTVFHIHAHILGGKINSMPL